MSNEIIIRPSYQIAFRPTRIGSEYTTPDSIKITDEQYQKLKLAIAQDRFVEINGELFNTSDIRSVEKIPQRKPVAPERWQFDSDEEYQQRLAEWQTQVEGGFMYA